MQQGRLRLINTATFKDIHSFFCLEESTGTNAQVLLLSDTESQPSAVAVCYDQGTQLNLFFLSGKLMQHLEMTRPAKDVLPSDLLFGFITYESQNSTLLWSNSLRGSVFALHVTFPTHKTSSIINRVAAPSNLKFVETHLSSSSSEQPTTFSSLPKIVRIVEIPSVKWIVSFANAILDSEPSLFCMSSDGISQIHLPFDLTKTMASEAQRLTSVDMTAKSPPLR